MAAPQPFNERFAESNYSGGIPLEPSPTQVTKVVRYPARRTTNHARTITRRTGRAARSGIRATGSALQASGLALQATGKTTKITGDATTRAGVALSSTGLGAIVGVPMAAGGRIMRFAGSATDTAGKAARRTGKSLKKSAVTAKDLTSHIQSVSVALRSITWTSSFWIKAQIPFAMFTVLFLGLSYGLREIGHQFFLSIGGEFAPKTADTIAQWSGVTTSLGALIGASDGLFFICLATTAVIGLIQLFGVLATYSFGRFNPLGGHGGGIKFLVLTICILGYIIPFMNFFPWVWLYLLVMVSYPK